MKPSKRNPVHRMPAPLLPPGARSRSAQLLTAAAATGRFALPACERCGAFAWPIPEACPHCLGPIALRDAEAFGEVLSATTAQIPADRYFRERAPWPVGLVQLDCGPVALTHLAPSLEPGARVRLRLVLDRAGQAVLHAGPMEGDAMLTDPVLREMTASPRGRRIMITDARHFCAVALTRALIKAEAASVTLGLPEAWKTFADRSVLKSIPGVRIVPLDVTSDRSVQDLAAEIGGKVDILINTADLPRPGGLLGPRSMVEAKAAMDVVAFGQMRLARSFGPALQARAADGAVAWVNLSSVFGLAPPPALAGYAAAHAAGISLSKALRAELGAGGIRLMSVLTGPTEDAWFQGFSAPRVTAAALADAIAGGLNAGLEEVVLGDIARDLAQRLADNPKSVERDMARGQWGGAA